MSRRNPKILTTRTKAYRLYNYSSDIVVGKDDTLCHGYPVEPSERDSLAPLFSQGLFVIVASITKRHQLDSFDEDLDT